MIHIIIYPFLFTKNTNQYQNCKYCIKETELYAFNSCLLKSHSICSIGNTMGSVQEQDGKENIHVHKVPICFS